MAFRVTNIVIVVALLLPAGALAQTKAPGSAVQAKDRAEAKAHYDQGTVHFNLDEWPQAIEEFRAAYRVYPDAIFLYNIAQCYRKMGSAADALSFYKKYLRERPDAPNRLEVEKRIDELEAARAAQAKSREAPPSGVTPPTPGELPAAPLPGAAGDVPAAASPDQPTQAPAIGTAAPPLPARADFAPPGADVTTSAPAAGEASSGSILRKWWFWTAVATAVAAGALVAVLSLSSSKSATHYQGDLDPLHPVVTVP
jgi:iron complex outermembrane receptor protein